MSLTLRSAPRISKAQFKRILDQGTSAGPSPVAPIADACYDIIAAAGLDPAVLLAIFAKESQYGVTGIAPHTKSWGNVRTAQVPSRSPSTTGGFAMYPSWRLGLIDLCDRLNLRYIARGLNTVEAAIPVYAPATENDTAGYIAFVLDHVAQWQAEEAASVTIPTTGYADRTALLTPGDNRPGDTLTHFAAMVIHETANEAPGATAEMHRRYWDVGGGGRTVSSAHFVADMTESIQLIPIDEQAWHAGDVTGNTTGVGIEICVNSRAGYPMACRKAAKVTAKVLHAYGVPPVDGTSLRKHGSYPGTTHKQCPQHLNANDWGVSWADFVAMVKAEYTLLYVVNYPQLWGTAYEYHEGWGIETQWKQDAVVLGKAISDEHSADDSSVTRHFVGGYVRYDPKTGRAVTYLAKAS